MPNPVVKQKRPLVGKLKHVGKTKRGEFEEGGTTHEYEPPSMMEMFELGSKMKSRRRSRPASEKAKMRHERKMARQKARQERKMARRGFQDGATVKKKGKSSFEKAFEDAWNKGEQDFHWNGKWYKTERADGSTPKVDPTADELPSGESLYEFSQQRKKAIEEGEKKAKKKKIIKKEIEDKFIRRINKKSD